MNASTLAAHRFGFGETSLRALQGDPRGWVLAQWREPAPLDDSGLLGTAEVTPLRRRVLRAALAGPGIAIAGPACVAKTFPGYWARLERLRATATP